MFVLLEVSSVRGSLITIPTSAGWAEISVNLSVLVILVKSHWLSCINVKDPVQTPLGSFRLCVTMASLN